MQRENTVPQSLAEIYVHIVFSTKERRDLLIDAEVRTRLWGYLAGVCKHRKSPALRIGGTANHVHILCRLGRTTAISDLIRELKHESSKWIKQIDRPVRLFQWQNGYGAFSISPTHKDAVTEYIDDQENHHRKVSFQDEFRRLGRIYHVELDERYTWD